MFAFAAGKQKKNEELFYLRITDNIKQGDDIGTACEVLEDLDLSLDLLFLDRLQHLDAALFIVDSVESLKDLRVLATSDFAHNLVVVLDSKREKTARRKRDRFSLDYVMCQE